MGRQVDRRVFRINRVFRWVQSARYAASFGSGALPLPVFSNGAVGKAASWALTRMPLTARAGTWLASPGALTATRWLGVAGGAASPAIGLSDLWEQGNPIDAFQRDRAGYVADVAGTAFSASNTAFLLAPNPVTGTLVVVTGVVRVGAEIVDRWGDDIAVWSSDRWDDATGLASSVWDLHTAQIGVAMRAFDTAATGVTTFAVDATAAVGDTVSDLAGSASGAAGAAWDGATDFVGDVGGLLKGEWF
ncbi:MAG: hypothetical protein ABIP17_10300 [Ilumatobacteraceae bacterium]